MATRVLPSGQNGPAGYQVAASAAGLRADRTDISFQNITPDLVRVDVHVTNDCDAWSPPTEVLVQSAPLGAFLAWQPLLTLSVPSLAPRTATVISGSAWALPPAAPAKP